MNTRIVKHPEGSGKWQGPWVNTWRHGRVTAGDSGTFSGDDRASGARASGRTRRNGNEDLACVLFPLVLQRTHVVCDNAEEHIPRYGSRYSGKEPAKVFPSAAQTPLESTGRTVV